MLSLCTVMWMDGSRTRGPLQAQSCPGSHGARGGWGERDVVAREAHLNCEAEAGCRCA